MRGSLGWGLTELVVEIGYEPNVEDKSCTFNVMTEYD